MRRFVGCVEGRSSPTPTIRPCKSPPPSRQEPPIHGTWTYFPQSDGIGYEARFTACGIRAIMIGLVLFELIGALRHFGSRNKASSLGPEAIHVAGLGSQQNPSSILCRAYPHDHRWPHGPDRRSRRCLPLSRRTLSTLHEETQRPCCTLRRVHGDGRRQKRVRSNYHSKT